MSPKGAREAATPRRSGLRAAGLVTALTLLASHAVALDAQSAAAVVPQPAVESQLATAAAQDRSALVSGWLPAWDLGRSVAAVERNSDLMRDASPFWFTAQASSGTVTVRSSVPLAARRSAAARLRAKKVAVIPSVSDVSSARAMATVLRDPRDRARHVRQLRDLAVSGGFDGIELSYQQFAFADGTSTWAATRPAWITFVRQLGSALHARGLKLAVAVPPMYSARRDVTGGFWVYDYAGMARVVDSLRILTYDYSVAFPGPISPLPFVNRTLAFATTVFPAERIRMGLPAYGRVWVARNAAGNPVVKGTCPAGRVPGTRSFTTATALTYLTARAGGRRPSIRFDAAAGESVASFRRYFTGRTSTGAKTSCTVTFQAWWMDSRGVARRVPLVKRYGLAGFAVWHLGALDEASWTALRGRSLPVATGIATVVSRQRVPVGSPVSIVSTVVGGVPAGTRVLLRRRALGSDQWSTHASARLGARGTVAFRLTSVRHTAHWRVVVPATPGHAAAVDSLVVRVVPKVSATPSTTRPGPGDRIVVRVRVTPALEGMAVRRQVRANGAWRTVATTHTTARGRATLTMTWPVAPVSLTYRVVTGAKGTMAAGGTSVRFTIQTR
jgi:spore germination protein YaaH